MASIGVTIGNYYMLDGNNVITQINPTRKGGRFIVEVNIPYVEAYDAKSVLICTGDMASFQPDKYYSGYTTLYLSSAEISDETVFAVGNKVNFKVRNTFANYINYKEWYYQDKSFTQTGGAIWNISQDLNNTVSVKNVKVGKAYLFGYTDSFRITGFTETFTSLTLNISYTQTSAISSSILPSSSFVQYNVDNDFNVNFTSTELFTTPNVTSGKLYYKLQDDSAYSNYVEFTGVTVTLPANSFGANSIYNAYIEGITQAGNTTTTNIGTYSTIDSLPTVSIQSPKNEMIYGSSVFRWKYTNDSGTPQYAYDIQLSQNGAIWDDYVSHVVSQNSYTNVQVSNLGTNYWRVRAYNIGDNAGAWSEPAMFINKVPPSKPNITEFVYSGRPIVRWNAQNQSAFEIQMLDPDQNIVYDSGVIALSSYEYLINKYIPNGAYIVRVRIQNIFGEYSDWASATYIQNIDANTIGFPSFNVYKLTNGVLIQIDENDAFEYYYLLRDNIVIAKVTESEYTDIYANGMTTYTLYGVTQNDLFTSAYQTIDATVESSRLIDTDGNIYDIHLRRGAPVSVHIAHDVDFEESQYLGLNLPEINTTKFRRRTYNVAFYYPNRIENLLGETLLYCDIYGNRDWVVVVGATVVERRVGNDISVQMNTCNYSEEIEYEL